MEKIIHSKQVNYPRLVNALAQNLVPVLSDQTPKEFFTGKVENFLTCLHLISYLKESIMDDTDAETFEELSLIALYKSLSAKLQLADIELLLEEMPKILVMPYPVVEKICAVLIEMIRQIIKSLRSAGGAWKKIGALNHEIEMLKSFQGVINK